MEYDELVLRFRPQPFYREAEAYQVSIRRSPAGHLGGAWLRREADQSLQESRLTPDWAVALRSRYRAYIERYWEAARDEALGSTTSSAAISYQQALELGEEMFTALPWPVQQAIGRGLGQAQQRGRGLRVVLEFEAEDSAAHEVAQLPWELLYDPDLASFLALAGPLSFVRRLPEAVPLRPLKLTLPLRLLAIVADPEGTLVPVDQDPAGLIRADESVADRIEVEAIAGPNTMEQMRQRLFEGNLEAVLIVAHGDLNAATGQGFLLLEDERGRSQRVDARFLRPLFNDVDGLQLVILSVCHSSRAALASDGQGNGKGTTPGGPPLAEFLSRDGVPAVVAMQDKIGIAANRLFLQAAIGALAKGCSVDEAVRLGRKTVFQAQFDPINWSIPVLYLQGQAAEEIPWYARLADALADWFWRPGATQAIAGTLAAALLWTLANLVVGGSEARPWPPLPLTSFQSWALSIWLFLFPGLVAALHHPQHPRVKRLPPRAQWVYKLQGASVGALVGTFSAALALTLIYYSPVWLLLPEAALRLLILAGLCWAAFMSYAQARAIPRAMTVNAHVQPPRLTGTDAYVAVLWPVVLLALLLLASLARSSGLPAGRILSQPAVGSALVAALLLALVIALRRSE